MDKDFDMTWNDAQYLVAMRHRAATFIRTVYPNEGGAITEEDSYDILTYFFTFDYCDKVLEWKNKYPNDVENVIILMCRDILKHLNLTIVSENQSSCENEASPAPFQETLDEVPFAWVPM